VQCRVQLVDNDKSFLVEADEIVLAAALRCNVSLAHDCQLGGCGTCRKTGRGVGHLYRVSPGANERRKTGLRTGLASKPHANKVDFHVRRINGGSFTDDLIRRLRPGKPLELELPLGSFTFREDYRPVLMVVTGTGIAPIKAMLEGLMIDPDCPPVSLYWGTRTIADLYLDGEIRNWGERLYEFKYVPVLSRGDVGWGGHRGYVQDAVAAELDDLSEYAIYLCGSPEMIAAAKERFVCLGASLGHIYSEGFIPQDSR